MIAPHNSSLNMTLMAMEESLPEIQYNYQNKMFVHMLQDICCAF